MLRNYINRTRIQESESYMKCHFFNLKNIFVFLLFLLPSVHAKEVNTVWTWVGVEVVTNDIEQVEKIRGLAQLPLGFRATLSDPVLPKACENVRNAYPNSKFSCTVVSSDGAESLYVIEMDKITNVGLHLARACQRNVYIDRRVVTELANLDKTSLRHFTLKNAAVNIEFINDEQYLDSKDPGVSVIKKRLHHSLIGKEDMLKQAVRACDTKTRTIAMRLLNFIGKPHLATTLAAESMLDEDEGMRNNAVRLLSSFHKFISPEDQRAVQDSACTLLENPSFTDRNKGLMLLGNFYRLGIGKTWNLSEMCLSRIRQVQKYSISNQLGNSAGNILKILGESDSMK